MPTTIRFVILVATLALTAGCRRGSDAVSAGPEVTTPLPAKRAVTVCARDCDYPSLQAALDGAASGDTVRVYKGRYAGPLVVRRSVTVRGDGTEDTIVTGGAPVLESPCRGCEVRFEGIAFADGADGSERHAVRGRRGGVERIATTAVRTTIHASSE